MPNTLHQVVASSFRDDPELAFDLLRSVFELRLPMLSEISDRSAELDRFVPCFGDTHELRMDVALSARVRHPISPRFTGAALVIEVQGYVSWVKRFRMWVYQALLAERLELPTALLCVSLSDEVSRWARTLGEHELPPRDSLLVLDRQNMPRVTDLARARERPARAMLSAAIHNTGRDLECARVALSAALELQDSRRWRYASAIVSMLDPRQLEAIKQEIDMEARYRLTEMELNSAAYHNGKEAGKAEGKLEGKLEAELEGLVRLVTTILELRGVALDAACQRRLLECKDREQLERWIERAKLVRSAATLFGPSSG